MFNSCSLRDLFTYLLRLIKLPFSRRRFFVASPPFFQKCKVFDRRNRTIISLNTQSVFDYWTVSQVFDDPDYVIESLARYEEIRRHSESFLEVGGCGLILDLGANIGASARLFSIDWPGSVIWCFEPSSRNFDLLRRNAGKNMKIFKAGVGGRDGHCVIENPLAQPDRFRVSEKFSDDSATKVELISMQKIMDSYSPMFKFLRH